MFLLRLSRLLEDWRCNYKPYTTTGESVGEEDQVELISESNILLSTAGQGLSTCTSSITSTPRCTCTPPLTCNTCTPNLLCAASSIPVIRGGTRHRSPCLVNLNEDPKEGEFLSIEVPEVIQIYIYPRWVTVDNVISNIRIIFMFITNLMYKIEQYKNS